MPTTQVIQDTHWCNQDIPCLRLVTHPNSQDSFSSPIFLRSHILHQLILDFLWPSHFIPHLSQPSPKIIQATHPMLDQAILLHTPNLTKDIPQPQQVTQQPHWHIQQSILHASQAILHPWTQATLQWPDHQTFQHKGLQVHMHLMSLKRIAT